MIDDNRTNEILSEELINRAAEQEATFFITKHRDTDAKVVIMDASDGAACDIYGIFLHGTGGRLLAQCKYFTGISEREANKQADLMLRNAMLRVFEGRPLMSSNVSRVTVAIEPEYWSDINEPESYLLSIINNRYKSSFDIKVKEFSLTEGFVTYDIDWNTVENLNSLHFHSRISLFTPIAIHCNKLTDINNSQGGIDNAILRTVSRIENNHDWSEWSEIERQAVAVSLTQAAINKHIKYSAF